MGKIIKKGFSLLILLVLCVSVICTVRAVAPLLVDDADLLTASEEAILADKLENLRDSLGMDVVIVTTESLGGKSAAAYADDYYDYNGYSANGILLLVSMNEREWYISTSGSAIHAITNAEIDCLGDLFVSDLSCGDYLVGFLHFADGVRSYTVQSDAADGISVTGLLVCIVIGVAVGFVAVMCMKSQMKSVRPQNAAGSYVVNGSFRLNYSNDLFLYRNVTRVAKPQNNSSGTHRSSSGSSHGGGGGRF